MRWNGLKPHVPRFLQADPDELPTPRRQIEGGHCAPNTPQGQGIAPAECGVVLAAPPAFRPMVKHALTRIAYALGLRARPRPIGDRPRDFGPTPATPGPPWTHWSHRPALFSSRRRRPRSGYARSSRGSSSAGWAARTISASLGCSSKARRGWGRRHKRSNAPSGIRRSRRVRTAAAYSLATSTRPASRRRPPSSSERLSYVLDGDAMTMTPMTAPSAGGTSTRSKRTSSSVTKTRPSVWSSRAGSARRTFRARRGWARGMILAGLVRPGGLLTYLRDQGVSADQLREVADGARTNAQS